MCLRIVLHVINFIFYVCIPHWMSAQIQELNFHYLGEEEGLSTNSVAYYLSQDSRGFIWIGNEEGLHRFDGQEIKTLKPVVKGNENVGRNIQSKVFEDRWENLWFTTFTHLIKYARKTNSFHSYKLRNQNGEVIPNTYRAFFIEKNNDRLWLRAGNEIFSYNTQDSSDYKSVNLSTTGIWFTVDTTFDGSVVEIWASPWVSTKGVELLQKNSHGIWEKEIFLDRKNTYNLKAEGVEVSNTIIQTDTTTWIFSDSGLIKLNKFDPTSHKVFFPPGSNTLSFYDGIFLSANRLLIASVNSGLWLFDTHEEVFIGKWENHASLNLPLNFNASRALNAPRALLKDSKNRLWITYYGAGIQYTQPHSIFFRDPFKKLNLKNSINVESIIEDTNQRIWVGTKNQGIYVFSHEGEVLRKYPSILFDYQNIRELSANKEGDIWLLTTQGCYYLNPNDTWTLISNPHSLRFTFLLHLHSGRKLLSASEGIYEIIKSPQGLEIIPAPEFDNPEEWDFLQLFQTSTGQVLIPYRSSQLLIYEETETGLTFQRSLPISGAIYSFWEDIETKVIYMGSSNGLFAFDNTSNTLTKIEGPSLNNWSNPYLAIKGPNKRLWIPTSQGLWAYREAKQSLERFRKEDGLPSNEFSIRAACKLSNEQIWLGTANGLCVFNPDSIQAYPYAPNVYIEELLVNSVPYSRGFHVNETDKIELSYTEKTLAFELKTIGYYLPNLSKIDFKLEGYEPGWTQITNGTQARFTQVPPGKYTLRLIPFNANGLEGLEKNLKVTILPPFWETAWFKISVLFLSFLLVWGGVQWYVSYRLREQKILLARMEARQEEQQRIGDDLHDSLGVVSNIIFLSDRYNFAEENPNLETFKTINTFAGNLVDDIRNIIWVLNSEDDPLEKLVSRIQSYTLRYLATYPIDIKLSVPDRLPDFIISSDKSRNMYFIVKECLHNIVRHAAASEVTINLFLKNGQLYCTIEDNGTGVDISKLPSTGNGIQNMKRRAEMMGGTVSFQSALGMGMQITLEIPLA